ncbi:unnamed protein product, partial [Amoebophrya sp. A25]
KDQGARTASRSIDSKRSALAASAQAAKAASPAASAEAVPSLEALLLQNTQMEQRGEQVLADMERERRILENAKKREAEQKEREQSQSAEIAAHFKEEHAKAMLKVKPTLEMPKRPEPPAHFGGGKSKSSSKNTGSKDRSRSRPKSKEGDDLGGGEANGDNSPGEEKHTENAANTEEQDKWNDNGEDAWYNKMKPGGRGGGVALDVNYFQDVMTSNALAARSGGTSSLDVGQMKSTGVGHVSLTTAGNKGAAGESTEAPSDSDATQTPEETAQHIQAKFEAQRSPTASIMTAGVRREKVRRRGDYKSTVAGLIPAEHVEAAQSHQAQAQSKSGDKVLDVAKILHEVHFEETKCHKATNLGLNSHHSPTMRKIMELRSAPVDITEDARTDPYLVTRNKSCRHPGVFAGEESLVYEEISRRQHSPAKEKEEVKAEGTQEARAQRARDREYRIKRRTYEMGRAGLEPQGAFQLRYLVDHRKAAVRNEPVPPIFGPLQIAERLLDLPPEATGSIGNRLRGELLTDIMEGQGPTGTKYYLQTKEDVVDDSAMKMNKHSSSSSHSHGSPGNKKKQSSCSPAEASGAGSRPGSSQKRSRGLGKRSRSSSRVFDEQGENTLERSTTPVKDNISLAAVLASSKVGNASGTRGGGGTSGARGGPQEQGSSTPALAIENASTSNRISGTPIVLGNMYNAGFTTPSPNKIRGRPGSFEEGGSSSRGSSVSSAYTPKMSSVGSSPS